jgi:hypothetical protein
MTLLLTKNRQSCKNGDYNIDPGLSKLVWNGPQDALELAYRQVHGQLPGSAILNAKLVVAEAVGGGQNIPGSVFRNVTSFYITLGADVYNVIIYKCIMCNLYIHGQWSEHMYIHEGSF